MRMGFALALLGVLGGCVTTGKLSAMSAPKIGCPAEQVRISDRGLGMSGYRWTAECKGRRYQCTYESEDLPCTCTEAPTGPAAAPAAPATQ